MDLAFLENLTMVEKLTLLENLGNQCDLILEEIRNLYSTAVIRHWFEIMALYYVKSILTEISANAVMVGQNHFF